MLEVAEAAVDEAGGARGGAAAEVTLTGDARMGVVYDDFFVGDELSFDSRARVSFNLSGETDGGLGFGASFRAADAVGAGSGAKGTVSLSGAFGSLSMGDESAAAEYAVGDLQFLRAGRIVCFQKLYCPSIGKTSQ